MQLVEDNPKVLQSALLQSCADCGPCRALPPLQQLDIIALHQSKQSRVVMHNIVNKSHEVL